MKTIRPDLTIAQIIGLAVAAVPVLATMLRAFGVFDMNENQTQALNDALQWAVVAAGVLFVSDAGLRSARNAAVAKVDAAILTPVNPAIVADPAVDAVDYDDLPSDEDEFGLESGVEPDVPEGDRA